MRKLNNLLENLEIEFYENKITSFDSAFDSNFQRKWVSGIKASENVKNYLLASREHGNGKHMQDDIDMYITKDRLREASFCRKLDPMFKNLLHRKNPLELVFQDISTFDGGNPIIGNLVKEIEIGKKDTANELVKKAPNLLDIELHSKLHDLRTYNNRLDGKKNYDDDDDNNNNGGFVPQQQHQQ